MLPIMRFSFYQLISIVFQLLCGLTAFIMVSYWVFKFHQNKDQDSIEYKAFGESEILTYPELSICVNNPYFMDSFEELDGNITVHDYHNYLIGNRTPNSIYKGIEFDNVTIDLFDHIKQFKINSADKEQEICNDKGGCGLVKLKKSFTGFWTPGNIAKCFSIELVMKSSRVITDMWIQFHRSLSKALSRIAKDRFVGVTFNFPNQFLRNIEDTRYIWENNQTTLNSYNAFKITHIEIIHRRFKQKEPCFEKWNNFDEEVLKMHVKNVSCKPPYLTANARTCVSMEEIKNSFYSVRDAKRKYCPRPCHELSNIVFTSHYYGIDGYHENEVLDLEYDYIGLRVAYPGNIKLITQNQLVDIHSLIGNIGGYIGLFLGEHVG